MDDWVELARSRGLEVRQADLSQPWPLEDESVDALHSNQVIEHMARTDHFMREVRRVLRPDGYAVLSTNNLSSWHNIVSLVLGWQPLPCHVSDESGARGNPATLGDEGSYGQETQGHLRVFTSRALVALAGQHHLALDRALASGYYPLRAEGRAGPGPRRPDPRGLPHAPLSTGTASSDRHRYTQPSDRHGRHGSASRVSSAGLARPVSP